MSVNLTFSLEHFQGSLPFLLWLLKKEEIEVIHIPIQELIHQFLAQEQQPIEVSAEFISAAAYLIWLKSKSLLPIQNPVVESNLKEEDPHFEIIHHLIEYSHFKDLAKKLQQQHREQQTRYFRQPPLLEQKKNHGLKNVTLEELQSLFEGMLSKITDSAISNVIQEESLQVADKIAEIQHLLAEGTSIELHSLFSTCSRFEAILSFLAILELMKTEHIFLLIDRSSSVLFIKKSSPT